MPENMGACVSNLSIFEDILKKLMDADGSGKIQLHSLAVKSLTGLDLSAESVALVRQRLDFVVMTTNAHPARGEAQDQIMDIITRGAQ